MTARSAELGERMDVRVEPGYSAVATAAMMRGTEGQKK